ncbi:hypothetical protein F4604DRAFT_1689889 [Suillus subluteus]|nr:hypothetical protein F4604DRAFT_1689889 [Suillus subluteus]
MSLEIFQFSANETDDINATGRQITPLDRSSHRVHPYSRSPGISQTTSHASSSMMSQDDLDSFIHGGVSDHKVPIPAKLNFKRLSPELRTALSWTRQKLAMKMFLDGWIPQTTDAEKDELKNCIKQFIDQTNEKFGCSIASTDDILKYVMDILTQNRGKLAVAGESFIESYDLEPKTPMSIKDRQIFMERRRDEISNSLVPFSYFLHGIKINPEDGTATLLVFMNPAVVNTHISYYYCDPKSPLWDESLRADISTTPIPGFAVTAAATKCAIDRKVEGRLSGSKDVLRFNANPYSNDQREIQIKMEEAYDSPIHGKDLKAQLLDIHLRGLHVMKELRMPAPSRSIYLPRSLAEMTVPLASIKHNTAPTPPSGPILSQLEHPQMPSRNYQLEGSSSATCYPQQGMATDELLDPQMGLVYREEPATITGTFYDSETYMGQSGPYFSLTFIQLQGIDSLTPPSFVHHHHIDRMPSGHCHDQASTIALSLTYFYQGLVTDPRSQRSEWSKARWKRALGEHRDTISSRTVKTEGSGQQKKMTIDGSVGGRLGVGIRWSRRMAGVVEWRPRSADSREVAFVSRILDGIPHPSCGTPKDRSNVGVRQSRSAGSREVACVSRIRNKGIEVRLWQTLAFDSRGVQIAERSRLFREYWMVYHIQAVVLRRIGQTLAFDSRGVQVAERSRLFREYWSVYHIRAVVLRRIGQTLAFDSREVQWIENGWRLFREYETKALKFVYGWLNVY